MKKALKALFIALVFVLFTVVTQIGGLIYALSLLLNTRLKFTPLKFIALFLSIYFLCSLVVVPMIAPFAGRTALPIFGKLKPLNYMTVLLNRHHVKPELKTQLQDISVEFVNSFPSSRVSYLDANFPFFDGFPLLPHLSHSDGKKVDLAFFYKEMSNDKLMNSAPSFVGYGVFEEPSANEVNYAEICKEKGYWQYGILSSFVPQWKKDDFQLDIKRTKALIQLLAVDSNTSKIFIEPHLKKRWNLEGYDKIRFHGCQAVRHDDHIHTQIF